MLVAKVMFFFLCSVFFFFFFLGGGGISLASFLFYITLVFFFLIDANKHACVCAVCVYLLFFCYYFADIVPVCSAVCTIPCLGSW